MAITPNSAVFDLTIGQPATDAAALKVWQDALTITTVYGYTVTQIGSTLLRYTIFYA